jgi:hypothetical protein
MESSPDREKGEGREERNSDTHTAQKVESKGERKRGKQ